MRTLCILFLMSIIALIACDTAPVEPASRSQAGLESLAETGIHITLVELATIQDHVAVPNDVNPRGTTVGRLMSRDLGDKAARWTTDGELETLLLPELCPTTPRAGADATAISPRGHVVGWCHGWIEGSDLYTQYPLLWLRDGKPALVLELPDGAWGGSAWDVTAAGDILLEVMWLDGSTSWMISTKGAFEEVVLPVSPTHILDLTDSRRMLAVRGAEGVANYSADARGKWTMLQPPSGWTSVVVRDLNNGGVTIGASCESTKCQVTLWDPDGTARVLDVGSHAAYLGTAITNEGRVAGHCGDPEPIPFIWTEDLGRVDLPLLGGISGALPRAASGDYVVAEAKFDLGTMSGLMWKVSLPGPTLP